MFFTLEVILSNEIMNEVLIALGETRNIFKLKLLWDTVYYLPSRQILSKFKMHMPFDPAESRSLSFRYTCTPGKRFTGKKSLRRTDYSGKIPEATWTSSSQGLLNQIMARPHQHRPTEPSTRTKMVHIGTVHYVSRSRIFVLSVWNVTGAVEEPISFHFDKRAMCN